MRKTWLAMAGLILTGSLAIAPAAQATISPGAAGPPPKLAVGSTTRATRVALPAAQCRALRRSRPDRSAGCTVTETIRLRPISAHAVRGTAGQAAASDIYWSGILQACAVVESSGYCDTDDWWVSDQFNFTTSATQAWDNGTPHCGYKHTTVSWCSYSNNGTSEMQEGFNFGSSGYARMDIFPEGQNLVGCDVRGSSYANPAGVIDSSGAFACPPPSPIPTISG